MTGGDRAGVEAVHDWRRHPPRRWDRGRVARPTSPGARARL